ncbi:LOW QUALITY PROTEIN: kelch-like protein 30 [Lampetra fluviatilis]
MLRDVDDLEFEAPSHCALVMSGLRAERFDPKLSDVALEAAGRRYPCHRAVLALCSPFFRAMFCGEFRESFSAVVPLPQADPAALEQLVDFAYTGRLTINQENVETLTALAGRLQFSSVREVCSRYLQQQISAANCLGIGLFAEAHACPEVAAKAGAFALDNFGAVVAEEEFGDLSCDSLLQLLSAQRLQDREDPALLLGAALSWVRRDPACRTPHLGALLGAVRLGAQRGAGPSCRALLQDPLLQGEPSCRALLADVAMDFDDTQATDADQGEGHDVAPQGGCPPQDREVLVVIGGRALQEDDEDEEEEWGDAAPSRNAAFYEPTSRTWRLLPDFPEYNKWGFSVCALNNSVYVTGGSRGSMQDSWSTTHVWRLNPSVRIWEPATPMLKPRTNHCTAALNGDLYAIGGTASGVVEAERYEPYSAAWSPVPAPPRFVSNFTASGCRGRLYLVGSCAAKYNALALQRYSPITDCWSVVASPFIPRYLSSPRCVTMDDVIYLLADNTKKTYLYDPDANMWRKVQLKHSLHENGGLAVVGGRLYVTGGHWQGLEGLYRVLMESCEARLRAATWSREGALPRAWLFHDACAAFVNVAAWPLVLSHAGPEQSG